MIRQWLISKAIYHPPGAATTAWMGVCRRRRGEVYFYVHYWRYGDDIVMDKRHWYRDILLITLEKSNDDIHSASV